jgi:hypothetical protein
MLFKRRSFIYTTAIGLPLVPTVMASEFSDLDSVINDFTFLVDEHVQQRTELQAASMITNTLRREVYSLEDKLRTRGEPSVPIPLESQVTAVTFTDIPDPLLKGEPTHIQFSNVTDSDIVFPVEYAVEYAVTVRMRGSDQPSYIIEKSLVGLSEEKIFFELNSGDASHYDLLKTIIAMLRDDLDKIKLGLNYFGQLKEYLVQERAAKLEESAQLVNQATLDRYEDIGIHCEDYNMLRDIFNEPEDWRRVVHVSGLHYPAIGSINHKKSSNRSYGNPTDTHHNGYGLCDEYAMHFISFLLGKNGYDMYLLEMNQPDHENVLQLHTVAIYQRPDSKWSFVSNNFVSSVEFGTFSEAVDASALYSGYDLAKVTFWKPRQVIEGGMWLVDDIESVNLRPTPN